MKFSGKDLSYDTQGAFVSSPIYSEFSKGTNIRVPYNHYALVYQDCELKAIKENTFEITPKYLPTVKMPLFGSVSIRIIFIKMYFEKPEKFREDFTYTGNPAIFAMTGCQYRVKIVDPEKLWKFTHDVVQDPDSNGVYLTDRDLDHITNVIVWNDIIQVSGFGSEKKLIYTEGAKNTSLAFNCHLRVRTTYDLHMDVLGFEKKRIVYRSIGCVVQ